MTPGELRRKLDRRYPDVYVRADPDGISALVSSADGLMGISVGGLMGISVGDGPSMIMAIIDELIPDE